MADASEGAEQAANEGGEAQAEGEAGGEEPAPAPPPPPPPQRPPVHASFNDSFVLEQSISYPEGSNPNEILSEQYENILRLAKAYITTLMRPKDIEVATDILRICEKINDNRDINAKMYNTIFLKYFVRVLRWSSLNQPACLYKRWYPAKPANEKNETISESRTWLEKDKSYISLKSFADGTTLLYAAVSTNPETGWLDGGLKLLEERSICPLPM